MYHGYWGKKTMLIIFIVGVLSIVLTYFFRSEDAFYLVLWINIVYWIGFVMGFLAGEVRGVYFKDKEPTDAVGGNDNIKPRGPEDYR